MATKTTEQFTYTETVYRDDAGNELGRERNYDDAWYDTLGVVDMTDEEIEDWS